MASNGYQLITNGKAWDRRQSLNILRDADKNQGNDNMIRQSLSTVFMRP